MRAEQRRERQPLRCVAFGGEHLDAAARLLAARHRRDRARIPALPVAYEQPEATLPLVKQSLLAERASGVAALRNGTLVGFLIGQRTDFPPDSTIAPYYRPASTLVRYHAHAAVGEGGWAIYRELYAAAAERWVTDGLTAHYVQLPAADTDVIDAWASVGFGRDMGWGLRDTGPIEVVEPETPLTIRRATPGDLEAVFQLDSTLVRHEARSPVFMPYPTAVAEQEWRVDLRYSLRDPNVAYWLAEQNGRPVGLLNVNPPPLHISPLLTPEGMVNIFAASVLPDLRGTGIGGVLLRHALDAARQAGHRWARMSWMTANLVSTRFWSRNGFQPVAWRMARVVDERALASNG